MRIRIADYPTFNKAWDRKKTEEKTKEILKKIGKLQYKMYAQNKFSLLIVFQGMDASGKDGVTKDLIKYCNAVGIKIHSFKKPTEEEFAHDFLQRVHEVTPARGEMQIFVRSHYEDILVPSVEKYIPEEVIEQRYEHINNFEKLIESNNTRILKFFLNVSKTAQKKRLIDRIELKEKHWKHKDSDWDTREKFDDYIAVYEKIVNKCDGIPWHIVPSDKNWQKTFVVADAVLKKLEELDIKWPELISERFQSGK